MANEINNKLKRTVLTGQLTTGFSRSVIALCELTNTNVSLSSWSSGTLSLIRYNGLRLGLRADVMMQKRQNSENARCNILIHTDEEKNILLKPCRFKYKGVLYGGIEIYVATIHFETVDFYGVGNFSPFGVDYYSHNTGTVIEQEIYNTITFDGIDYGNSLKFNDKNILTYGDTTQWFDLVLQNGFEAYAEGLRPQYCKVGNLVITRGAVKHTSGITPLNVAIAALPSNLEPSQTFTGAARAGTNVSGYTDVIITIDTYGVIYFSTSGNQALLNAIGFINSIFAI